MYGLAQAVKSRELQEELHNMYPDQKIVKIRWIADNEQNIGHTFPHLGYTVRCREMNGFLFWCVVR